MLTIALLVMITCVAVGSAILCLLAGRVVGMRHGLHGAVHVMIMLPLFLGLAWCCVMPLAHGLAAMSRSLTGVAVSATDASVAAGPSDRRMDLSMPSMGLAGNRFSDTNGPPQVSLRIEQPFTGSDFPVYLCRYRAGLFYNGRWSPDSGPQLIPAKTEGERRGWVHIGAPDSATRAGVIAALEDVSSPLPLPLHTPWIRSSEAYVGDGVWLPPRRHTKGWRVPILWHRLRVIRAVPPHHSPAMHEASSALLDIPDGVIEEAISRLVGAASDNRRDGSHPLTALLKTLQDRCDYSEDMPTATTNHPLVDFLEAGHAGHCRFFATAFVFGARALGYPARICVGYVGGERDDAGRTLTFFPRDAHAWAQVRVMPGHWLDVDPTPHDSRNGVDTHPRDGGRPSPLAMDELTEVPTLPPLDMLSDVGPSGATRDHRLTVWLLLMAGIGIITALGILTVLSIGGRSADPHRAMLRRARSPRLIIAIEALFQRWGQPWPRGRTLQQHTDELRARGQHSLVLDTAVKYLYDTCFASLERNPETERRLQRELSAIRNPDQRP